MGNTKITVEEKSIGISYFPSFFNPEIIGKKLSKLTSITPLVTFRIAFGAIMFLSTARFIALGWIEDHYLRPKFHFKYYGFEWVPVFPDFWIYTIHFLLIISSLGVMLGLFYRISAILLFLSFTYTELLDLTYYLNHYYFVSIVCLLMVLVPANRYFSLDVIRKPSLYSDTVPEWTISIFKWQLAIVYIYAGLAKINYDWLFLALPLKIWLPAHDKLPVIGNFLKLSITSFIFSWVGMLYDSTIVFFLMWRKTRLLAYLTVVIFHILTGMLFQIGVFPLVMMGATLIFFSAGWHQNLIEKLNIFKWRRKFVPIPHSIKTGNKYQFILYSFLVLHFAFQLLFPWRYLLYPGSLFWTEEGYRFSWRVMLIEKAGLATFYIKDSKTGREGEVINSDFLNEQQEKQMSFQPDMILQYAHFLSEYYEKKGMYKPQVRAEVYVTLNAKLSKLLIDPKIDLTKVKDNWKPKTWILSDK